MGNSATKPIAPVDVDDDMDKGDQIPTTDPKKAPTAKKLAKPTEKKTRAKKDTPAETNGKPKPKRQKKVCCVWIGGGAATSDDRDL